MSKSGQTHEVKRKEVDKIVISFICVTTTLNKSLAKLI